MIGGLAVSGNTDRSLIVNDMELSFMVDGLAESGSTDRVSKFCKGSGT